MIGRSVSLLLFSTLAIVGVAACGTPTGDPPSTDGDEASTSAGHSDEGGRCSLVPGRGKLGSLAIAWLLLLVGRRKDRRIDGLP